MFLKSKFLTVGLLIFVGWIAVELIQIKKSDILADNEMKNTELKISELEKNNEELKKAIDNSDNPEFLEIEAKLKLNYKKIDENVAFIYRSDGDAALGSENGFDSNNLSNYKKWWLWLLGK